MTVIPAKTPPFRVNWPVFILLLVVPVVVLVAYPRLTRPPAHIAGAKAAGYLQETGNSPDRITRVSCTDQRCAVWLHGGTQGYRSRFLSLGPDISMLTGDAGAGGYLAISDWRIHLVTTEGTLSAACTSTQAHRITGTMSPALVNRWCPTFFVPSGL